MTAAVSATALLRAVEPAEPAEPTEPEPAEPAEPEQPEPAEPEKPEEPVEPAPAPIPDNYLRRAQDLAGIYTKWARMNKEPFESKGHEKMMVVSWASKSAKATFVSGEKAYPVHSLIAKEGYKDGKPVGKADLPVTIPITLRS